MSRVPARTPESQSTTRTDRVHRMRAARGACWVIVAGAVGAVGLVLLDAVAVLPGWVRGFGLATWLTAVGVLAWRFILGPWREIRSASAPAPTAVQELPDNLRAVTAAAISLAVCLAVATLLPGAADHLRRVAFPWQRGEIAAYRIVVTSGDAVVARGGTVTLSAYVERTDPALPAATKAIFAIRTLTPTREVRVLMPAGAGGDFHLTRAQVVVDFEYRVEVGGAVSDWFAVTAIDPTRLADGSTTEIIPPAYAPDAAGRVIPSFAPLDGIAQATAEYRFRFDRPATAASLEFLPAGGQLELTPVTVAEDGMSGAASFRLKQNGTLRLVLVAEAKGKKLRAETPVSVRVRPDDPPRFTGIRGVSPRSVSVRPGDAIAIAIEAADDVAVGGVVLEYTHGASDSRPITVPFPITGAGSPAARGRLEFMLPGSPRNGDEFRIRIRVSDTRQLDDTGLKPQHSYYPAGAWLTVRVDSAAPPLPEQEITGRRDVVRESLAGALAETRDALENVEAVLASDKGEPTLATENTIRLTIARDAATRAASRLRDAASEAGLNPVLRPLAVAARAAAARVAEDTDDSLRRAAAATAADRPEELANGSRLLADVAERADALLAQNDRLARDQLDARALDVLAADLSAHARRVAVIPHADAAKAHRELLDRFEKLLADSTPLRTALDGARYQEFQRLAGATTALASAIGSLNAAAKQLQTDARAKLLGWIAREQEALAARAAELLARVDTAARIANVPLPRAERFGRVPGLVTDGRTLEALAEAAGLAQALDAVAERFEKWAADRGDTKVAVRHLSLWQEDLRSRFRAATAGTTFATLPAAKKSQFRAEQTALAAAFAAMKLPPGEAHRSARDAAFNQLQTVRRFLDGSGADVDRAMEIAAGELKTFADRLPTVTDRFARTRDAFDKLWREQESIQTNAEQVLRNTPDPTALAKKLAPLANRQLAQLAAFESLDLPGLDARRVRTGAALAAATGDLAGVLPQDVPASQVWAKRELDWVRVILSDNAVPPDDRADEIARRLSAAAAAVEKLGLTATENQLAAHGAAVQDILKQLNQFPPCPEAPILLGDLRDAVLSADAVFRNGSPFVEKSRRLRAAAAAAERLANRLGGGESDLDRLRRLATARRSGAAYATALREKKEVPNPAISADLVRQLGREIEELTNTRVGAAGQLHKKRTLDLYTRLKDGPAPERMAGIHTDLATSLEELAALVADVAELTATFDRARPATAPSASDAFLPSRPLAADLRELARAYRVTREGLTDIRGELATRLSPTNAKPLLDLETRQRDLATEVAALARKVTGQPKLWPAHPDEAAEAAVTAADRMRDGGLTAAKLAADSSVTLLKRLATAEDAKAAAPLAIKQAAILKELEGLLDSPGVGAARQRLRAEELARELASLVESLERAARDAGPDDATAKSLTEAADTTKAAGKFLADAARAAGSTKTDEAARLRTEAEATLRGAAGAVAGTGPVTTTLPNADGPTAAIGESLRRADAALRHAGRDLGAKPNLVEAETSIEAVADELRKAAKETAARLAAGEK